MIIYNKCSGTNRIRKSEAESVAIGVDIIVTSAKKADIDSVSQYIVSGKTYAFIGSSGAGKSTLITNSIF